MRALLSRWILLPLVALAIGAAPAHAQLVRQPVLFDTDLGNDVDDAFALALLLASPEIDVRGVTSVGSEPEKRALFACRFLTMTGRRHVAVATGLAPADARKFGGMYQYYYHPDVLFNRTIRPAKENAVDFIDGRVQSQPGRVTICAAGPLTNLAKWIAEKPKAKAAVQRIIVSAGNIRADLDAAKVVFNSGIPLVVIPKEATAALKLTDADRKLLFAPLTPLSLQMQALDQLSDEANPGLADVLAAALCIDGKFCEYDDRHIIIDAAGEMQIGNLQPNAKVVTKVKADEFRDWYVGRMASCVKPAANPAKAIDRGAMPFRVHVAEDYDLDIEKRWWMAGKAETKNLFAADRVRACRGVLTHDFDDLLGNPKAMWTGVVFNPVPGPPMGKNPRLNFSVWLDRAPELRVQIYSLTNGYHRHLILKDLPQKTWQNLTVDMSQTRRPDGTGGPLGEGERIDDIQFYVEPDADLIIDDVVLYDAAPPNEKRPFPKRIHFSGTFDSGKQGKEWPGDFTIAANKGFFWHAAEAVSDKDGEPWIRLGLRGSRPLGAKTHLSFRYLTAADKISIRLADSKTKTWHDVVGKVSNKEAWSEMTVDLTSPPLTLADEIQFRVPRGAALLIDDVLLYEP